MECKRYDYRGMIERGRRYRHRGMIERGARYQWRQGYSATTEEGKTLYPWLTKEECRTEASAEGKRAIFYRDGRKEGKP